MNSVAIPADVSDFVLQDVESIAQLEALLLLRREPGVDWTLPRVSARLYIPEPEANGVLQHWVSKGLFVQDGARYVYRPVSADRALLVDRVASLYVTHLIPITHLIHSRQPKRIQAFADAFRLKKGP